MKNDRQIAEAIECWKKGEHLFNYLKTHKVSASIMRACLR